MKSKECANLGFVLFLVSSIIAWADNLQPLGDEFNSATTQNRWLRLYQVEGWGADQLERWAFTPSYAPGQMVMIPYSCTWYAELKGELVHKNISGDFIATARLRIARRPSSALPVEGDTPLQFNTSLPDGAPTRLFSIGGIFVRRARNITNAAPDPQPVGVPTWPPPAVGVPGHYVTDWSPDGENYLFLALGASGNAGTWQYEGKSTISSTTSLYFTDSGIPTDDAEAQFVTLQLVKIGNTAVTLRKHDEGPWILENRYTLAAGDANQQMASLGSNMQIGIATYTDWPTVLGDGYYTGNDDYGPQFQHNYSVITGGQPDLVAMVDYFHLQRPPSQLTEALLATLPITYPGNTPAMLSGTSAEEYVGDRGHTPLGLLSAPSFGTGSEEDGFIEIPISLAIAASNSFSIQYSTIAGTASTNDYTPVSGTLTWAANQTNTQTILVPVINEGVTESVENLVLHLQQPDGPVMLPAGVLELDIPLFLNDSGVFPMTNEISLSAIPATTAVNEPIILQNYLQYTNGVVTNLVIKTNGNEYATIPVTEPGLYTTNITLPSAGSLVVQTISLGSPLNATSTPVTITFTNSNEEEPPPPPLPSTNTNTVIELSLLGLRKQVVRAYPSQTGDFLREVAFPQKTFGKIVAVNDFNGDGTNDFISVKGKTGHLFVASGTTFVEEAFILPLEKGRRIIGSGDATEDGKAELFTLGKKQLFIHDFPTFGIVGALTDFRFSTVMVTGQQSSQLLLFKAKSNFKQETIPLGVTNAVVAGALTALPVGYKMVAPVGDGSILAKKSRSRALVTLVAPDFSVVQSTNYPSFPGGKIVGPR